MLKSLKRIRREGQTIEIKSQQSIEAQIMLAQTLRE
jgi:hypothetical protein